MPTRRLPATPHGRRAAAALAALLAAAALAGCGASSTPPVAAATASQSASQSAGTASGSPDPAPGSGTASPGGSATPAGTSSTTPSPTAPRLPGGRPRLLPDTRLVAFYGAAGTGGLGVLGAAPPEQTWTRLAAVARGFAEPGRPVVPTFELITTVADDSPGPDGDYSHGMDDTTIARYHDVVRRHGGLLLLDLQPGRSSFVPQAKRLERWLREPDVALALDPEWRMGPGDVPGRKIGSVHAAEVNAVSAWLEDLTVRTGQPQKLLLVHQFTTGMVLDKPALQPRKHLAMAFNMDGFGGREVKLSKYRILAADRRFGLGMKLFYKQDVAIFRPREVLALKPAPSVVEYQ